MLTSVLVPVITLAEMLYLFVALVTGNWGNAITSLGVYALMIALTYALGYLMAEAGLC